MFNSFMRFVAFVASLVGAAYYWDHDNHEFAIVLCFVALVVFVTWMHEQARASKIRRAKEDKWLGRFEQGGGQ